MRIGDTSPALGYLFLSQSEFLSHLPSVMSIEDHTGTAVYAAISVTRLWH